MTLTPTYDRDGVTIFHGDARAVLEQLPAESVNCCVTSPPYWGLRDYGVAGQLGLEKTPDEYVAKMVDVFREVRRVLTDDGTLWLNLGDSYAGSWSAQSRGSVTGEASSTIEGGSMLSARQILAHPKDTHTGSLKNTPGLKAKDLCGIPWRAAFALQADGWWLRQDIIWHKPNPMPESVTDRCTKSHEYLFLLAKSERYYYDQDAISEPCVAGDNGSSFTSEYDVATKPGLGTGPRKVSIAAAASRKSDAIGVNGRNVQDTNSESERRDTPGSSFNNNPRLRLATDRNRRSVWTVTTQPYPGAHFATFPPKLIEPCILAGCPAGGVVLDPFLGSGTTAVVAQRLGCKCVGIELNEKYIELATKRLRQGVLTFSETA